MCQFRPNISKNVAIRPESYLIYVIVFICRIVIPIQIATLIRKE